NRDRWNMATDQSRCLRIGLQFGPQKRELFIDKFPDIRSVRNGQDVIEHDESPAFFSKSVKVALELQAHPVQSFAEPRIITFDGGVFSAHQIMVSEGKKGWQIGVIFPNPKKLIDQLFGRGKIEFWRFVSEVPAEED